MARTPTIRSRLAVSALVVALGGALLAGCSDDGGNTATDDTKAPPAADESTVDSGDADWTQYGHDLANSRLNAHETIVTAETAGDLTKSWSIDGLVGVTSTPTMVEGMAFFGDWTGSVRAVDPETGEELWTTKLGGSVIGSVAVDGDALYAASGAMLYRLNRESGTVEWQAKTNDHPFAMISASPVVADGLVFQGVASGEVTVARDDYTFLGSIGAYDAETGEEKWRLMTTPGDDTGGAGVGVWSTPAVDTDRGVLYVGTGNTYEEPTAPLADSIVAIDYRTGEVKWSTQFTAPDVFAAGNPTGKDADVGASPNLWTSGGRDLVGAGDKAGVFHTLDRETGDVVWEKELTPGSVFGGDIGSSAFVDGMLVVTSNVGNPENNSPTNATKVFALDASSGDVVWESDFEGLVVAPVSAVPGVAFVGTNTGTIRALDTSNGKELWSYDTPNQVGSGPAILDGNVLWGYGYALFGGPGEGGIISFTTGGSDPESGGDEE